LFDAMNAACFKVGSGSSSGDAMSTHCGTRPNSDAGASTTFKFNPLLQSYSGSTLAQNDVLEGVTGSGSTSSISTLKAAFDDASTGKQITQALIDARAAAWAKLHLAKWLKVAYAAEEAHIGIVATKAD